jgi:murein DD-endopeptidase MepM/ murein hydrolase activator NlpD
MGATGVGTGTGIGAALLAAAVAASAAVGLGRAPWGPDGGTAPRGAPPLGAEALAWEREAVGPATGSYGWPVLGPVLRPFEPPATPFGPGHRGIDIGAPFGTATRAAQDGVVAFAGQVAGSLFVSIDHPDGVRTTYSWLSAVLVVAGQPVRRGQVIARTGQGHPGSSAPHLHFGARAGDVYLDPMLLLGPRSVVGLVRLAPLEEAS